MFLFERIFGFTLYMIVLIMVCAVISRTNIKIRTVLCFYTLILCAMAYFYKPYVTADLYRIYETMDMFSRMEFDYFWNNFAKNTSIPIARLLFWCVGKTGVNQLISVFATFVCYSMMFYTIVKTQKKFNVSNTNVAYVLFFVMSNSIYISVIGGIRMMLALSMITFSFFRGTVEKKIGILDIAFYISSVFIHTMSVVVLVVCMVMTLIRNDRTFIYRVILTVVGVCGIGYLYIFAGLSSTLYEKFTHYVFGDSYTDTWEYVIGALIVLMLIIMAAEFRRVDKDREYKILGAYNGAMVLSLLLAIGFCFEFSIFYRFGGHLAVMFSIPAMMVTLEKSGRNSSRMSKEIDFKAALLVVSLLIAVISCTRGSLSALKFFEL